MIIGCSHGMHVAQSIARKAKQPFSKLEVERFPDGELHIKFLNTNFKRKKVYLVQSFYDNIDSCLIEVMFAAKAAKELGASSVCLLSPFFPYFRQDTWFSKGEIPSIHFMGQILDGILDEIVVLDPHLHREKTLGHIFKIKAHKLTANGLIADYIKKKIKKPLIVGPDWESYKWARKTAEIVGCESTILLKTRHSARNVDVRFQEEIDVTGKNVILIDDMIATGNTLIKTIKKLRKLGVSKVTCFAAHGIFAENGYEKLKKTGAQIICSNTLPNPAAKLDVSTLFGQWVKK